MKMINENQTKMKFLDFEAEDVNDPDWDKILNILRENGIKVFYGNGDWINLEWQEEWEK